MNLEDHLGDIIRKARAMSNVSTADAARSAGLSVTELGVLEESGIVGRCPDLGALAGLLGLDAAKLGGIARGWLPAEKDLSAWRELRVFTTTDGSMAVNSSRAPWAMPTIGATRSQPVRQRSGRR